PDNGQPHTESYSYDALGETVGMTDRNETTHAYSYDVLGRQTSDAVTLGPGRGQGLRGARPGWFQQSSGQAGQVIFCSATLRGARAPRGRSGLVDPA
ncbi:MAG: RHS repeat protein, partial [Solirubrobacterales bacterium]|nr:RHS repeat protein [Solirubrobacterales bacterium]